MKRLGVAVAGAVLAATLAGGVGFAGQGKASKCTSWNSTLTSLKNAYNTSYNNHDPARVTAALLRQVNSAQAQVNRFC